MYTFLVIGTLLFGVVDSARVRKRDGDLMILRCTRVGTSINIGSVYYGSVPANRPTSCSDPDALTRVSGLCDTKEECSVDVSAITFTGTTCSANVRAILSVTYTCDKSVSTAPSTAQGQSRTLTCNGGSFISITSASYGFGRTLSCSDANALSIVDGLCSKQETCTISVDDTTFPGSTCAANRPESLQVAFTCTKPSGALYTAWGSMSCGSSASLIYAGLMSGARTGDASSGIGGNGVNYQCLPTDPIYDVFNTTANDNRATISIAELVTEGNPLQSSINGKIPQCAFCQSISSPSVVTLVGQTTCPAGWTEEYNGYVVSEKAVAGRTPKGYVCLKNTPDVVDNTTPGSADTSKVYLAEIKCGTLPCASYTNNDEIACIVCSV